MDFQQEEERRAGGESEMRADGKYLKSACCIAEGAAIVNNKPHISGVFKLLKKQMLSELQMFY